MGPSPVQVSRPFPFKPEFVPFSAITQDGQLPTEDDTVRLSYLCSHCESTRSWMQDRIADPKAPWRVLCRLNHYDTTSQLEQSARAGCHLCTLLFKPHDLVEENLSGLEIFQFPTQSVATANYTRGPGSPYIRIGSMNTLSIISSQGPFLLKRIRKIENHGC